MVQSAWNLSASVLVPKTNWLPMLGEPDLTYHVWAANVAYDLTTLLDLPFRLGVGAGYSRTRIRWGNFTASFGPTFEIFERSEQFSLGVGIEYGFRLGWGITFKNIVSSLGPLPIGQGEARPSARDVGIMMEAPVFEILKTFGHKPVSLAENIDPVLNITFGYARRNISDDSVIYPGIPSSDPLPRSAIIGLSAEVGVAAVLSGVVWRLLTFTLAREAEDLLVERSNARPKGFSYQSGLGDIAFFRHVIGGRMDPNERVTLHKGWQIALGEFLSVRGGSINEDVHGGNRNFTTSGFSIRLGGLFKLWRAIGSETTGDEVLSFLIQHLDIAFDSAKCESSGGGSLLHGTKFSAVTIIVR